jgi:hypothetical protein
MLKHHLMQAWCMSESDSDFEMLEKRLEALTPDESILVRGRALLALPAPFPTRPLLASTSSHVTRRLSMDAGVERFFSAAQSAQRDGRVNHCQGGEGGAPRRGMWMPVLAICLHLRVQTCVRLLLPYYFQQFGS